MAKGPKCQEDQNDKKIQITRRPKWQEDPSGKKTQVTTRPKWQKDTSDKKPPNDKKAQMTKRFKCKKTQVTRRHMWQEEWVAKRLTTECGLMVILQFVECLF